MSSHTNTKTVLFSDIVGSSRLYSSLGNEKAKEKIDHLLSIVINTVLSYQGKIIKTIGDEVMCVFDNPEHAFEAAISFNSELLSHDAQLKTGLCYGNVIFDESDSDVYGDTVNNAAYLVSVAQAGQILFDANTLANLPAWLANMGQLFDRLFLKGHAEKSLVYRLLWEQQKPNVLDITMVSGQAVNTESQHVVKLILEYQDKSFVLRPTEQPLVIGRDATICTIWINHKNASRKHCSIYFHRGKFVFEDHSTNGCYLLQENQQELFLRRESTPLVAQGQISVGQPTLNSSTLIKYRITNGLK